MTYEEFLDQKTHTSIDYGIDPTFFPSKIFEFQKHVSTYAIKKGRCAVFLDTGLGKTVIELTVATNYHKHTNKPVLIITPLAVAFQFIKEAEKFGIRDVSYSKDGKIRSSITICNYERLQLFDPKSFDCVILDESSILKNFEGKIRSRINEFVKMTKYRFLFTATPSPNDYIELGTSSEALGYLGYADMLGKFFKNNNNNNVNKVRLGLKWYLKPHAEKDFWMWVSSWSISMKKPSDFGYDDTDYNLPKLHEIKSIVRNNNPLAVNGQHRMFALVAQSFREIRAEVRATIDLRCEMAVDKANDHQISVYWVNLNDEAEKILQMDTNALQVKGSMTLDQKEEILLAFSNRELDKLVTKTSITAFGLNWQHCNHTTYFPTYSYEQYYQAIRRFYRFGQKRNVFVDLILSDGQTRIMDVLMSKKDQALRMFENLTNNTNGHEYRIGNHIYEDIKLPSFISKKIK